MKNVIKLFLVSCLFTTFLFSCKKEENKINFEGGTAPVLAASSTADLILDSSQKSRLIMTFTWTNPDYKFNTGVNSHDVSYTLQVDTTNSNFTSPDIQEVSILNSALRVDLTVKEVNSYLNKLGLQNYMPHHMEFRMKSSLESGSVPLYSNVIKVVITPFLDVALPIPASGELYITGNGVPSDWTNAPPANQKCTKVSITEYNITMNFTPGKFYKFLSNLNNWQPQYGLKSGGGNGDGSGGLLGLNPGGGSDPDAIPTPALAGRYKVTLNFITGKYKTEKL